jgi:hypothetical protein
VDWLISNQTRTETSLPPSAKSAPQFRRKSAWSSLNLREDRRHSQRNKRQSRPPGILVNLGLSAPKLQKSGTGNTKTLSSIPFSLGYSSESVFGNACKRVMQSSQALSMRKPGTIIQPRSNLFPGASFGSLARMIMIRFDED